MPDILHDFVIRRPPDVVFTGIAEPSGLDQWWTSRSRGRPAVGEEYELWFGPDYDWRAVVIEMIPDRRLVWRIATAMPDWVGTVVGFDLATSALGTDVQFRHEGWAEASGHFRTSSYCWAMYLRILARHLEHGETVPYEDRLAV
jgi:uncharacterized protein YndB with AHSA1/START domain